MSAFEKTLTPVALGHVELEATFQQLFTHSHRTRLVGGGTEPLYRPATNPQELHTITYSYDYAASALHEVAHWCVAGAARRQQEDYGYWYAPDGRTAQQQNLFEQVEVKPQALEWIFSVAAGRTFRVSADNLEAELGASQAFKDAVYQQVQHYCQNGLPERADAFAQALATRTGLCTLLTPAYFQREAL